ncbi:MAG: ribosome maturation factor RimM [bacterium]|nr:ribosome maturation factor RimM [bacterium]
MQSEHIPIGRIKRFFGTKGYVRVDFFSYIPKIGDILKIKKSERVLKIEDFKEHKNGYIVKFEEINSIEEAKKLRNTWLLKEAANILKETRTLYFVEEIASFDVVTEEKYLGKLIDVLPTKANDIFVVKGKFEYLIPAKKHIVKIDTAQKKIYVNPPPGLLEIFEE